MSFVLDAIDVKTGAGATVASISRNTGPLERGYFDETGTWVPTTGPERLSAPGFGVDDTGPYFDTVDVDPDDAKPLMIDAGTSQIWLEI